MSPRFQPKKRNKMVSITGVIIDKQLITRCWDLIDTCLLKTNPIQNGK
jgi:hypothetical protein